MTSHCPRPSTRELFERALSLPASRREAFLEEACRDEPERLAHLRRLVRADDRSGELTVAPLAPMAESNLEGREAGGFRFERRLGSGGMGVVYEARQIWPERRVALKLVQGGLVTRQVAARFQREAAVLAHLEHPDIARLYEAGSLEIAGDSVPYLALELIEQARPVTQWAFEESVPLRERLAAMSRICRAVHFGHQRGVIHRDLKPDNLLVDGEGNPHVIDFGIARALDSEEGFGTLLTQSGHLIGTPRYMSPEQLGGDVIAIDFRTDVYSLGLVLFEILTGEPCRPARVSSFGEMAKLVAKQTTRSSRRIDRTIPRDLDMVVQRALESEPERRYGSAAELGLELDRFLAGEPVRARRDHAWYVMRKWFLRHRVGVSVLALIFVILSVAVIALSFLWQDAREAREESEGRLYLSQIAAARNALEVRNIAELKQTLAECDPRFRDWEWGHLMARSDDSVLTFEHPGLICDVAYSPDGKTIATAATLNDQSTLRLWDAETGRLEREFPIGSLRARDIHYFPAGDRIVTATSDRRIRIFDTKSGALLGSWEHPGEAWSLWATPDGSELVTGGHDGVVRTWDLETHRLKHTMVGHGDTVTRLAYSTERDLIASGSRDRTLRLWDRATGKLRLAITQSIDRSRPGLPAVPAHGAEVSGLAFSPGGQFLLSASPEGVGKVWDVETGKLLFYEKYGRPISRIDISRDGRWVLAACSDSIIVTSNVNARALPPLLGHTRPLTAAAFSPDGRRIASVDRGGTVKVFETGIGQGKRRLEDTDFVRIDAMDVCASRGSLATGGLNGIVRLFDTSTLLLQGELQAHHHRIFDIRFDPTGQWLASSAHDGRLRIWKVDTRELRVEMPVTTQSFVRWTGEHLVTAGNDGRLTVHFRGDTFEHAWTVDTSQGPVTALAVRAPLGLIVTGSGGGLIKTWSLKTGQALGEQSFEEEEESTLYDANFSGQSLWVASSSGRVWQWSASEGEPLQELPSLDQPVFRVLSLSKGRVATIAVSGSGPTIRDAATGRVLLELTGHDANRFLTDLVQLPDGSLVVSADDGGMWVWRTR